MDNTNHIKVVSAAAGTGKTTRLVREYLGLLSGGIPPDRIVAITFTRKAAAELIEAVSNCLRQSLGEPVPEKFQKDFADCYSDVVPCDPEFIRQALAELPNAPAGTTDSFVLRLLGEFALDARLPTDDGGAPAWLDFPVGQGDAGAVFDAAIRETIDPEDGNVPEAAGRLLEQMGLRELLKVVSQTVRDMPSGIDGSPVELAGGNDVLGKVLSGCRDSLQAVIETNPKIETLPNVNIQKSWPPIAAWRNGGFQGSVPEGLFKWYSAVIKNSTAKERRSLESAFRAIKVDLGLVELSLHDFAMTNPDGFIAKDIDACDRMRADIMEITRMARSKAFRMAAASGALDHDLLTRAAIDLCRREDRPDRLRRRFDALLVDEVQDSSPAQFSLFRAIENLPGDGRSLRTFYVGDSRQSIYLFRGAEPAGLKELEQKSIQAGFPVEQLDTNYRSTPEMITAQKALFDRAIHGHGDFPGLPGVTTIDHVQSNESRGRDELPPSAPYPEPIVMVTLEASTPNAPKWVPADFNNAALDVFCDRIMHAWNFEGRGDDTAAVLCSSWANAINARNRIRSILRAGNSGDAFLDGSRELAKGIVAGDIRTVVSALWDSSDDIAWAGLWRLPMIGLSDGALAAFRAGSGLLPADGGIRGLAWAASAQGLDPAVFGQRDFVAFARVRPVLEKARSEIGRVPTADVLEEMAAALHWRSILLKGPGGMDAVGELEVILDWIRQAEADTVDPEAVVTMLDPKEAGEVPRVELYRGKKSVSCTTIHQAKGLKYDHVCVMSIGSPAGGGGFGGVSRGSMVLDGRELALLGVSHDPEQGIHPRPDPVSRLAAGIDAKRSEEELLRLVYVAVTRAVRSVTFATGSHNVGIHGALSDLWMADDVPMEGVKLVKLAAPNEIDTTIRAHVRAAAPFPVKPCPPAGWISVSPSMAAEAWKTADADALDAMIQGLLPAVSVVYGADPLHPPKLDEMAGDDPISDSAWGNLVHSWMESTGLRPGADVGAARAFLESRYGIHDDALAGWLAAILERLELHQPELLARLRSPEATLHFEMPFAGVNTSTPDSPWFHAGRMDLLVTFPGKRAIVVDFKAGRRNPVPGANFVKSAGLDEYMPQLEAYRQSLTAAGWTIETVGLLYMRSATWLSW
ncbi:MAG TPA: UvrD-helicase domain-containing protein [Myxococcota bacterium]|nr:UvrD-helicase domain-containing protein [Myxococcota bacterium]